MNFFHRFNIYFLKSLKNPYRLLLFLLRKIGSQYGEFLTWEMRDFSPPSPHYIKQRVLQRHSLPDTTWIESGTHLGLTTKKLAKYSKIVYTIEPEPKLYSFAKKRLATFNNVHIINSLSEVALPTILKQVNGNVCFWLDGHFSAGNTHKGPQDTPIIDELSIITSNLSRLDLVVIMVDDVRCFDPNNEEYSSYPSLSYLVNWAHLNKLNWIIEHDIFIAKNL
jgi:hypothetical protein